jgi:serine/threonine-protein kinase ULK/ATG1
MAMKVISLIDRGKFTKKIINELKLSKMFSHKNIVQYYDAYYNDKNVAIMYEYCDGDTLKLFIHRMHKKQINNAQKELLCKKILCQIRDAIVYMHNMNIIHRDLKPENIMFKAENNNYVVKLIDFGFSKFVSSSSIKENGDVNMHISTCGTPLFMAPELLCGNVYNIKSDLWSFGIIMYQMLYSKMPFSNVKEYSDLVHMIKNTKIEFPNIYSSQCLELMMLLLNKNCNERISWEQFIKNEWFHIDDYTITKKEMEIEISNEINISEDATSLQLIAQKSSLEKELVVCDNRTIELSVIEDYIILD